MDHYPIQKYLTDARDCPDLLTVLKTIAEIIQNVGIGIGAVLAGFGGWGIFKDWQRKAKQKEYIKKLRSKYPRQDLNRDFKIVNHPLHKGWIFLLDNRDETRSWIKNPETLRALGLAFQDALTISKRVFNRYHESEETDINSFD